MVKRALFVLVVFLFSQPGWCDYQELKDQLDQYSPPGERSVDLSLPAASPGQEAGGPLSPAQEKAFHVLMDIGAGSESVPVAGTTGMSAFEDWMDPSGFFTIPRDLEKKLSGADTDDHKAMVLLQGPVNPDLIAALAVLRNPGVAAARSSLAAERASFSQVADLDLVLARYSAFTEGLMNGVGPVKGRQSVQMIFPFPGVTALKGRVVAQAVMAAGEAVTMAEREAVTGVQKAFWDLVYLQKALAITRETLALLKNLNGVAESLYRAGKTGFQDVTRITVKVSVLEDSIITLREKQLNTRAVLLSFLNLPPDVFLGAPVMSSPSLNVPVLEALYPMAENRRQELRQMRARIVRMEYMLEMAETLVMPGFDLGFSQFNDTAITQVGSQAMVPGFPRQITASMGQGLPKKPWYGVGASWLEETKNRITSRREALRGMESDTRKMVRLAWYELDRAVRTSGLYGNTVVSLSRKALDVSTREYESGRITFADVAGSYSDWLQACLGYARSVSDIAIARIELERVMGTRL